MADKKFDMGHGLGDLGNILHNQGVSDLSWLAVDEDTYRAAEALPKQNLDVIPELQKALALEDDVPHVIPLRPHTIVNSGKSELAAAPKADMTSPIRNRVAAMVIMGMAPEAIGVRLSLEFDPKDIELASESIKSILDESGLLGNVYVDAAHFPRAASDAKTREFIKKYAKNALFVIGGCQGKNGCNCHQTGICSTFDSKRVVSEVPYGRSLAVSLYPRLAAEHRPIEFPNLSGAEAPAAEWKQRIQAAFRLTPIAWNPDGVKKVIQQDKPKQVAVTKGDVESFLKRRQASPGIDAMPSPAYLKHARRMMEGHDDVAALTASTDADLQFLASEYGVLGHTYIDIDAAGGCRQALSIIESRGLSPDFAVRRSASCAICMGAEDGACAAICGRGASIVHQIPDVSRRQFGTALVRAARSGRMMESKARTAAQKAPQSANWRSLVAQVNLYKEEAPKAPADYSGTALRAAYLVPGSNKVAEMDPEEVRRTISHLMNTGLSGRALQVALLQRYSREDLAQVPEVGRRAAQDDGVQGHYFIDPTAYNDYGKGCNEGAKQFRKRGAPYALASSGCTGCQLQTAPGWCSKYAKGLLRQVPTQLREAVASSRRHLPVVQTAPVENPVEKFELASELPVDIKGSKSVNIQINLPAGKVDG